MTTMDALRITSRDVAGMVEHWLRCPPNGYLGSGYGSDVKALLHTPMASGLADDLIAKARQDVPMLRLSPDGMVNVYAFDEDMDRKVIRFEVGGELLDVTGEKFAPDTGGAAGAMALQPIDLEDVLKGESVDALHTLHHVSLPSPGYW